MAADDDAPRPYRFGADGYLAAAAAGAFDDARVELVDGAVIAVSPQSPAHAAAVRRIVSLLIRELAPRHAVGCRSPVRLAGRDVPEPDAWVAAAPEAAYGARHPEAADLLLACEVGASSSGFDARVKAGRYAAAGVPLYWLLDLESGRLLEHADPRDGAYRVVTIHLGSDVLVRELGGARVEIPVADLLPAREP